MEDAILRRKVNDTPVFNEVYRDHNAVTNWVSDCINLRNKTELPPNLQNLFNIGSSYIYYGAGAALPVGVRAPSRSEKQLLVLSKDMGEQRLAYKQKVDASYYILSAATLFTIIIGMLTTILVSLSSTEYGRGDGPMQNIIRIFAIILPAVGTASAGIVGFYGPQAEWSQATRSLASISQLHGQIAIGIWKITCVDPAAGQSAALNNALDDWSKRFIDIQTVSSVTGGPATANSGAGSGSPNATANQGGSTPR